MEKNSPNSGLLQFEAVNLASINRYQASEFENRISEFVNGNKRKVVNVEDALQQKMAPMRNKHQDQESHQCSNSGSTGSGKDNGKSFPCPDCHKSFATEVDLKAHLMRHITQHPYVCLACGKGFKYEHTLDFHIKSQHGAEAGGGGSNVKNMGQRLIRCKKELVVPPPPPPPITPTNESQQLWGSMSKLSQEADQKEKLFEDKNNNNTVVGNVCSNTPPAGGMDLGSYGGSSFAPRSIQIKSEKVLISTLEGVHPLTDQTYTFYKCSLCGFAFPSLEPVSVHVQSAHSNQNHSTCDKCGATFKWRSELSLHEQLHKAMEEQSKFKQVPTATTGNTAFLQPNFVLMSPFMNEFNSEVDGGNTSRESQGLNLCTNSRGQRLGSEEVTSGPGIECQSDPKISYNIISGQMPVGDIEETAPGQFKCRFCDKTFDRIFSVHRHERVHTGYKPCICKVCGRGFSEKRNLRHHIIRFHSDGSGRELLRRVRKTGSTATFLKKAAVRLLTNNYSQQMQNKEGEEHESMEFGGGMGDKSPKLNYDQKSGFNQEKEGGNQQQQMKSSSSRRKSKPTKKISLTVDNVHSDEGGFKSDPDEGEDDLDDGKANELGVNVMRKASSSSKEESEEESQENGRNGGSMILMRSKLVDPEAECKMLTHGAFFSSYNPRLGMVEKPIKRHEACRPQVGPDGKFLYPCGYCKKTFCSLSDLNRHMNFHEDVRPFKCQFCDYQSRTNSQLKVHMLRHAGIKQYLCQICNYNGVTQSDLNRHNKTRSHLLRSENVCPLCSLGFSTRTLLSEHVLKFHETSSSINILAKVEESQKKEAEMNNIMINNAESKVITSK